MRAPAWWSPLLLLAIAPATPASAGPGPGPELGGLPAPVKEYVAGWQAHDGARVDRVVDEDGGYRDPSLLAPISGPDLADHVESFRPATVELVAARRIDAEHLDLTWRLTWPDPRGAQTFVDHLTVAAERIRIVVSEGPEIPAALWPTIEAYFGHRARAEAEATAALFGADGVLESRTLPKGGIGGERLVKYFEADATRKLAMRPGGTRQLTKDGRAAVDFELTGKDGSGRVTGRELFTIAGGKIRRLTGLF